MDQGEDDVVLEPVSPLGQYFSSSALSMSILAILDVQVPINDSQTKTLLQNVFLPINRRFSSIMVEDENGEKKWKKVEVKLEDHIHVPRFPGPTRTSPEFYDDYLQEYLSKIASEELPESQPLWEIHIVKYPTSNAAGNIIFKLHHSLGDGFSLIGALLSCLQRADDPSIPLTFPSRQSNSKNKDEQSTKIFMSLPKFFSGVFSSISDFASTVLMSNFSKGCPIPTIGSGTKVGWQSRPMTLTTLTFSLDHIKQIKDRLKVTVNDVIMGVIFLGTRLYMQSEDDHELRDAPFTALVVLNTRAMGGYKTVSEMVKPDAEMPWGNYFTLLHIPIPKLTDADFSNPNSIVKQAHKIIKKKRNSAAVLFTGMMLEILRKLRGPEAPAQYLYNSLKTSIMAVSNLIGPVEQMALANHPIKGLYFTVIGGPENLDITMVSYMGNLRVAIHTRGEINSHRFTSCIGNAFDKIFKAANETT